MHFVQSFPTFFITLLSKNTMKINGEKKKKKNIIKKNILKKSTYIVYTIVENKLSII